jgi:predicted neuraminidase
MNMGSQKQRWFWTAAVLGLTLLPLARNPSGGGSTSRPPAFAIARPTFDRDTNALPRFASSFIDPGFQTPSVHVASLCEISSGRLLATWYGGTREGARDVNIYTAMLHAGATNWSAPRAVVTRDTAQRELGRYVKKVGNALLFSDGGERVNLLYVSIAFGGWSGSALNLKTSADGGQTWSPSQRLQLSPFLNISELVKNQPAALDDGGWVVPIYHELAGKFSELLWLSGPTGSPSYHKTRVNGGVTGFQPALVPLSSRRGLLLARDNSKAGQLWASRSEDAGDSWSALARTGLPNPFSGLDAIRLRDGRVLLAFNDTQNNRSNLRLAVSPDGGATWQRSNSLVEEEAGQEFSYPFLLQSSDGLIHLVYTWKRKGIRHVLFNSAWLDNQLGVTAP